MGAETNVTLQPLLCHVDCGSGSTEVSHLSSLDTAMFAQQRSLHKQWRAWPRALLDVTSHCSYACRRAAGLIKPIC